MRNSIEKVTTEESVLRNTPIMGYLIGRDYWKFSNPVTNPLKIGKLFLKLKMKEEGYDFKLTNVKIYISDFSESINEIREDNGEEPLSLSDNLDEIISDIMWSNAPNIIGENNTQVSNDYIRLVERELYQHIEEMFS